MKKVNSLYIEFEPISGVVWSSLRCEIQRALSDHVISLITWETGQKTSFDPDSKQIDLVDICQEENL